MDTQPVAATIAPEMEVPRDFVDEINRLLADLRADPESPEINERVIEVATEWLQADGLPLPSTAGKTSRVELARWLAHLGRDGRIVHFGLQEEAFAPALSAAGASVVSYLDHPGRAIAAAIRHGSPTVSFATLDDFLADPGELADVVVVEAHGPRTVIPLDRALTRLRAGGYLAVLGHPVLADVDALVEVATFRFDRGSGVRPSRLEPCDPQLSLYRLAAPSQRTPGRVGPTRRIAQPAQEKKEKRDESSHAPFVSLLGEVTAERGDESPEELELRERAERIRLLPIPDQDLIDWVGGGTPATFDGVGRLNAFKLMMYCRMRPTDRILEPGCGCGRNAKWIAPYLDANAGAFHGFDIYRPAIEWAERNITAHYPNVVFEFADIANTNYNPQGKVAPHEYVFPYEDESFDLVFLPSVFTHMTDESFLHYTREIRRVLREGGLLLSWHFLLNDVSRDLLRRGTSSIDMQPYDEVSWARYPDNPCAAIAFDERYVLRTYESLGLRAQRVVHGSWCGGQAEGLEDYQDIVLARKRER